MHIGGVTLIELMIVIVILGIAATMAAVVFGNNDGLQVQTAGRELTSILLFAQTKAISDQQAYQVVFDTDAESYEVRDSGGVVIAHPFKKVPAGANPNDYLFRVSYPAIDNMDDVVITSANFDGTGAVWFDLMGAPHSGNIVADPPVLTSGSVIITAGANSITVQVEPVSGRIQING